MAWPVLLLAVLASAQPQAPGGKRVVTLSQSACPLCWPWVLTVNEDGSGSLAEGDQPAHPVALGVEAARIAERLRALAAQAVPVVIALDAPERTIEWGQNRRFVHQVGSVGRSVGALQRMEEKLIVRAHIHQFGCKKAPPGRMQVPPGTYDLELIVDANGHSALVHDGSRPTLVERAFTDWVSSCEHVPLRIGKAAFPVRARQRVVVK